MKTASHSEVQFLQLLWMWATDRISRALRAIEPKHRASEIAADIAAGGNPTGI